MAKKYHSEKARSQTSRDPARKNTADPKSPTQRKLRRQAEANTRQAFYDELTLEEKIDRVATAPGDFKRQLSKLVKQGVKEGKMALAGETK